MTALSTSPLDRVLKALATHDLAYELSDDSSTIVAQCPLHEDLQRSLALREAPTSRNILVRCFACDAPVVDVAGAIGIHLEDLVAR